MVGNINCFAVCPVHLSRLIGLTRDTIADANTAIRHAVPEAEPGLNV